MHQSELCAFLGFGAVHCASCIRLTNICHAGMNFLITCLLVIWTGPGTWYLKEV